MRILHGTSFTIVLSSTDYQFLFVGSEDGTFSIATDTDLSRGKVQQNMSAVGGMMSF